MAEIMAVELDGAPRRWLSKPLASFGFVRKLVPEVGIEPTRGVNPTGF
jgi:hypothetical protein